MYSDHVTTQVTAPKAVFHKNHSSHELNEITFEEMISRPSCHDRFANKNEFLEWCSDPATKHIIYSLAVPKNPHRRASKKDDNEIRSLRGLVADYDSTISGATLAEGIKKCPADFPVAYSSATFSGGVRLVWFFEKPVLVSGDDHAKQLVQQLAKEIKLEKLLPGLDANALLDVGKYYELGRDWTCINANARISSKTVEFANWTAAKKLDFHSAGPVIPIEVIEEEMHRKFPGRWQGPFTIGARGVRFWDPSSSSQTGAWVCETGVYAFTGEGRLVTWSEIFGPEFVKKFEGDRIAGAISGAYYNPANGRYWRKVMGVWTSEVAEPFKRHLVASGLRSDKRKGERQSEVERALHHVENTRRIDGAAPILFRSEDVVSLDNKNILNVSRAKVVQPLPGRQAWSEGFPWIAEYLSRLFPDQEQRDVFLSWLARFYRAGLAHAPKSGQVLVIAGPVGAGKTLLSQALVGSLMGGSQEALAFLTGKTEFNSELFEVPLWTIDDPPESINQREHQQYSELLKRQAANQRHTYRVMYSNPVTLPHVGRVIVTANTDEDSIRMLPSLDHSAADKFIFLQAGDTKGMDLKDPKDRIEAELPSFAAFLRDYEIPPELIGGARYGVVSYKHPDLIQRARDNSPVAEFVSVLATWRVSYFKNCEDDEWTGTAADLVQAMTECDGLKALQRSFSSANQVGRDLAKAVKAEAAPWLSLAKRDRDRGRQFTIRGTKIFPSHVDDRPKKPRKSTIRPGFVSEEVGGAK